MTRTIWLASYPKSGNTWMRLLIANLSAVDGQPADINNLEGGGIASARGPFDHQLLIESGLLTHEEIDGLRPRVYEALARCVEVLFVKAHDAYTHTAGGEPLLGGSRAADGAILIVRDPRDVAPSLANHLRCSIDAAIDFLNKRGATFSARPGRQNNQFRQQLLCWSSHTASWLDQADIPVHLVRYEDMAADAAGTLRRALDFAGSAASREAIERAVAFADFSELRRQEQAKGFREAPHARAGGNFFRRGMAGAWREELAPEQVARIEAAHAPMMQRLGYDLSAAAEFARAG